MKWQTVSAIIACVVGLTVLVGALFKVDSNYAKPEDIDRLEAMIRSQAKLHEDDMRITGDFFNQVGDDIQEIREFLPIPKPRGVGR